MINKLCTYTHMCDMYESRLAPPSSEKSAQARRRPHMRTHPLPPALPCPVELHPA
ncbi:hypothetical protein GMOD_00006148 [Pyrenophora seminiperda CCB06]|uniref:Uncharacterized protein n=1 Tax=Pyrenophora seminiperda CCB06 TaxID=1302712 RepID=A0A3M7M4F4_9PLEO|nr:hypothetical protein GMOD_00006148 [Pyrenophora seminiperda CCB06]